MSSIRVIVYETPQANVVAVRSLYYSTKANDVKVRETNVSFVGRFTPQQINRAAITNAFLNNFAYDFSSSAVETNQHFIGKFTAPVFARFRYNVPANDIKVVETNVSFIGRFTAPQYSQAAFSQLYRLPEAGDAPVAPPSGPSASNVFVIAYPSRRSNLLAIINAYFQPARDAVVPAVETNVNFIGRFVQPQFTRFNYNTSAFDYSSSAVETNVHFIGRFRQPEFSRFRYNVQAQDIKVAETNVSFIGRFTPVTFTRFNYNTAAFDYSSSAVETNVHFLGRFTQPIFSRFNYNTAAFDFSTVVVQPETNVSFIGRFSQPTFSRFNYNTSAFDFSSSAVETNPHFLGRFAQPVYNILPLLRQNSENAVTGVLIIQPETNTHFIGRFTAPAFMRPFASTAASDFSSSAVETNVSFIAKHTPVRFTRFNYQGQALDLPQPETNTNFIARHQPIAFARFRYNSAASDTSSSAVETNQHFIARFNPVTFARFNYNSAAYDFSFVAPALETNVSFIGRFTAPQFARFNYNASAYDVTTVVAPSFETNVSFIGKFTASQHFILPALRQNTAQDFSGPPVFIPLPGNNTFVIVYPSQRSNLAAIINVCFQPARDVPPPPQPETNTNFIAKFNPYQFFLNPALRFHPAQDFSSIRVIQPETNTYYQFIGKFTPIKHNILRSLRIFTPEDFGVPPPVPAQWRLLSDHYVTDPSGVPIYHENQDVLVEGVDVPIGWKPTLASEPLNASAIQQYWNFGPQGMLDAEDQRDFYPRSYVTLPRPAIKWVRVPGTTFFQLTGAGASLGPKDGMDP